MPISSRAISTFPKPGAQKKTNSNTPRREASVLRGGSTFTAPATLLEYDRDLSNAVCAMPIVSLSLEGFPPMMHKDTEYCTGVAFAATLSYRQFCGWWNEFLGWWLFTANSLSGFFSPLRIGREYSNRCTSFTL